MNPFSLLKTDHEEFKSMLAELEDTTERAVKTRSQIFEKLMSALAAHETIEEEILYPAIKERAKTKDKDLVLEAYAEHHVADLLVAELANLPVSDEMWGAKAKVLRESLEHHIEEEEGDLFKSAKSLLDQDELDALGDRMNLRKRELLGKSAAA